MKKVLLMRHAKSDWSNNQLTDHQRPLNNRGKRDAPGIGQEILHRNVIPEVLLVSDSQRTRDTWELLKNNFPNAEHIFLPELYLASAETIAHIITEIDPLVDNVLVLAHNPGITDALKLLGNVNIDNVPTAGVGCLSYDVKTFEEILTSTGKLEYFIYPKGL